MLGTATAVRGHLLVEEPGPWGEGGVPASRLGDELTGQLRAAAAARGVKLLLIRRPDAARRDPAQDRRVFLVDCRRGGAGVLTRRVAVADLAAAVVADDGWSRHADPLLLVCTHGRKDWCCAMRGRPVAAALAELAPDEVWECSHLGGDRFAASVLALPSGILHGRVDPSDAGAVVTALREDRVLVEKLRGRSCDPVLVQAADVLVRRARGLDAVDALRPARTEAVAGQAGTWRVEFRSGAGALVAVVREGRAPAQRLTCSAAVPNHARTWELVSLDVAAAPATAVEPGPAQR
ncbi:sucrase ferredoxin [Kineococcus rubinsiae]|uniref:sucrase ferredoxin n=1 Tax=Kineococcus rubinsiae TaxID=2609562 RepID=UPI00143031B9|nr:sucrase ferredoxin [Kineococcus rubinsiae]